MYHQGKKIFFSNTPPGGSNQKFLVTKVALKLNFQSLKLTNAEKYTTDVHWSGSSTEKKVSILNFF